MTNGKLSNNLRAGGRNSLRQPGQVVSRRRALAARRVTSVYRPASKWDSGRGSSSAVVIAVAQRNPDFTGKTDQGDGERAKRNHEEDGDYAFVLYLKERRYNSDDHEKRHRDTCGLPTRSFGSMKVFSRKAGAADCEMT